MKALVIVGIGVMGSNLVPLLVGAGYQVPVTSQKNAGYKGVECISGTVLDDFFMI